MARVVLEPKFLAFCTWYLNDERVRGWGHFPVITDPGQVPEGEFMKGKRDTRGGRPKMEEESKNYQEGVLMEKAEELKKEVRWEEVMLAGSCSTSCWLFSGGCREGGREEEKRSATEVYRNLFEMRSVKGSKKVYRFACRPLVLTIFVTFCIGLHFIFRDCAN